LRIKEQETRLILHEHDDDDDDDDEIIRENVASFWLYFRDILAMHGHMNVKNSFRYVRPIEKEAELLIALLQGSVRGCFVGWKALKERCVLSDGKCSEGDRK